MTKMPELSDDRIMEILGDVWYGEYALSIPARQARIRQLLAAQRDLLKDYRQVPSVGEINKKLLTIRFQGGFRSKSIELHRWLMEER